MSYILEALRRSEEERRRTAPAVPLPQAPVAIELPRRAVGVPLAALAVAAAAAILSVGYWIAKADRPLPATVAAAPVRAEPGPAAREPLGAPPGEAPALTARAAPEIKRSPFAAGPRPGAARDLSKEARVDVSVPQARAAPASRPPAAAPVPTPAELKFLHAMPDEFRRSLPELAVTIHIYAPEAANRILYINNRQYRAGDRVRDGIRVEEIVEDGAVLSYRGRRFKLRRPS